MATVTLKGTECHTNGELPNIGDIAPSIKLTNSDLAEVTLDSFANKKKILNIVPSLDTDVCKISTKKFNEYAAGKEGVAIIVISADLPFAQGRFCSSEKLSNVVTLSMMRSKKFAKDYGVLLEDGPLAGITARAVVVLDTNNKVLYTELVPDITQEPNYEAAMKALS